MTCIVGLVTKDRVIIGGDSAGISGYDITVRSDPKVFRNGPFLIGYTSSFRMGQLLRFRLKVETQHEDVDDFEFMATVFVDAVRDCLKAYGVLRKDNDVESGGTFLVGYKQQLYEISDDFQVGIPHIGFAAVGCGAAYATGALAALDGYEDPQDRVRKALRISEMFNIGVRGPFKVEELTT